ncbi:NAD(P)-dependent alcohol dehydrogenase, partial [Xanthomonas perforans]|nr:NAD(P)-dependent alcohol dehydrogenase [Xanthomonas perforans]
MQQPACPHRYARWPLQQRSLQRFTTHRDRYQSQLDCVCVTGSMLSRVLNHAQEFPMHAIRLRHPAAIASLQSVA